MPFARALYVVIMLLLCYPASAQHIVDVHSIRELVRDWNRAEMAHSTQQLAQLCDDQLHYFGKNLTRAEYVSAKARAFRRQADTHRELKNELFLAAYSTGAIRCDFVITLTHNGKATDRRTYLILKEAGEGYKITGEGELTYDGIMKDPPELGSKVSIIDSRKVAPDADEHNEDVVHKPWTAPESDLTLLVSTIAFALIVTLIAVSSSRNRRTASSSSIGSFRNNNASIP